MFQNGDAVVYGIHGVCAVVGTEKRVVDRKTAEYYVLEPVQQKDAKFYVPMHNPKAVGKIRKILSREELTALLRSDAMKEDGWISNENLRKEKYRGLIARADCAELIRTIRALYFHKQEQLAAGKRLHQCDENFMKDAQRVICSEVSMVMGIPFEEVGEFLRGKMDG